MKFEEKHKRLVSAKPLFAFDLDSTVTRCELLPLLAREVDMEAEMAALTESCMENSGDFAQDFIARVELLRSIPIDRAREIAATVPLHESIAEFLRQNALRCRILTGNLDVWIADLIALLGMEGRCLCSCGEIRNNRLLCVRTALDKGRAAAQLPRPFVAVGDGSNDIPLLRTADFSVAFGGSRVPPKEVCRAADVVIYDEIELCDLLKKLI